MSNRSFPSTTIPEFLISLPLTYITNGHSLTNNQHLLVSKSTAFSCMLWAVTSLTSTM